MVFSAQTLALAASLAGLLLSPTITASPLEYDKHIDVSNFGLNLHKRQDPGPGGGAIDASGIEPEDEDPAQIAADGTGPLRSGKSDLLGISSLCLEFALTWSSKPFLPGHYTRTNRPLLGEQLIHPMP